MLYAREEKTPSGTYRPPDADDFEACGLKCAMRRHGKDGHWCGYVGVPNDHTFFGKHKNELPDLDVHGGITFSGEARYLPGLWSFGFDCGHLHDLLPGQDDRYRDPDGTYRDYRDYSYVRAECERLAAGLCAFSELWEVFGRAADRLDHLMEKLMEKNQ